VREESTGPKGLGLRAAAHHDERQALLTRSTNRRGNDFDGYIEIPTISISHLHWVCGETIIINTRIWEGWSGVCWLRLRQAVQLNAS
jgi:hypothetical protein